MLLTTMIWTSDRNTFNPAFRNNFAASESRNLFLNSGELLGPMVCAGLFLFLLLHIEPPFSR